MSTISRPLAFTLAAALTALTTSCTQDVPGPLTARHIPDGAADDDDDGEGEGEGNASEGEGEGGEGEGGEGEGGEGEGDGGEGDDGGGGEGEGEVESAAPTCTAGAVTGYYCAGDNVVNGVADALYLCQGPGPASAMQQCDNACVVAPPGEDDYCASAGATCDANASTGLYCAGDKVSNGTTHTLYRCEGPGAAVVVEACSDGCVVAPAGQDDHCALAGATCDANASNGYYCAGDKVSHGVTGTLYLCDGPGDATIIEQCSHGCVVAPSGQDDYCAQASATCDSNASTGDYCAGDKVSNGTPDTLYRCNGPGPATIVDDCAQGCVVAPAGQDDYCGSPPATCDSNASTGTYCAGDKVSNGTPGTLYFCDGPGPAEVEESCDDGCIIAPPGVDDYCAASAGSCPNAPLLKWGLAPAQSNHLRCAGVSAGRISQTIGNAAASAGTHAQDGTIAGHPYCAATDISASGMTNTQIRAFLSDLADQGIAGFYRNPGHDGWPSGEARHFHVIYVGVPMKASLRSQVHDWLNGKNGLASHTTYTFWQASASQKNAIEDLFNAHN